MTRPRRARHSARLLFTLSAVPGALIVIGPRETHEQLADFLAGLRLSQTGAVPAPAESAGAGSGTTSESSEEQKR